ncbi:MAG: ChaN family lipoprotein [Proteobacteria bacterium]|nr:ChaN family lipoprotein [Pseudomonadota bacterium]
MRKHWKNTLSGLAAAAILSGGAALAQEFNAAAPYGGAENLENNEIMHMASGARISGEQMLETIAASRVIHIGEQHDNPEAHRAQMEIIRALHKKFPGQIAVGMEMFRADAQPALDAWHEKKLSDADFKALFCANWGGWYGAYEPLLEYLKDNSIPVVGLFAPREMSKAVLQGKTHEEIPSLPELDLADPHHKKLHMGIYGQFFVNDGTHATNPDIFYRMTTFRDEIMAQNIASFLAAPENVDKKLVVLEGDGHVVYGLGVPKRAFRRHPHAYSIVLTVAGDGANLAQSHISEAEKTAQIPMIRGDFMWKIPFAQAPGGQCLK